MKIYSRILGIITSLIALFFLGVLIYYVIFEADESAEKLVALIGLIPIYVVLHFVIIHRFGFNLKLEYSTSQGSSILMTSLVLFVILLSLVGWQISEAVALHKQEEILRRESEELYSHLSKVRMFEKQIAAYGFEGELQTKISQDLRDALLYKLTVTSKKPFNPDLVRFTIEFHDKDGFLIKSVDINDYVRIVENDKVYGLVSNSKIEFSFLEFGAEEVESMANWRLLISRK